MKNISLTLDIDIKSIMYCSNTERGPLCCASAAAGAFLLVPLSRAPSLFPSLPNATQAQRAGSTPPPRVLFHNLGRSGQKTKLRLHLMFTVVHLVVVTSAAPRLLIKKLIPCLGRFAVSYHLPALLLLMKKNPFIQRLYRANTGSILYREQVQAYLYYYPGYH